ncbi:alanine--tRNA ligase [Blattabacterium cuenoti]|uniref:alanine--tRNA ligase n=1 Tax=Blattabacterium cuenoti TaxID=1653831 RepID=UPI00163CD01E|nr:alanine--tRNA ligase [Blattabacterium cuenoti]
MQYQKVKNTFLNFFQKKDHKILPSFPIYLDDDPSLLFINSGMNPFKDIFLGKQIPKYHRIANIQKCLRISGKHNDLENVGYDNYHHTMFEMLGNWSFGDYSRQETIEWAIELLTKEYHISKENIFVTIFLGNDQDQLSMDKESLKIWKHLINHDHILFFGKNENFWEMGEVGPCGPSSEIHIDLRSNNEKNKLSGKYLINKGHPKVIEIWNLVFIEFFRQTNGKLKYLSKKHVDTGMGLERLCMVLQGVNSSYETDIFITIIHKIKNYLGNKYTNKYQQNISINIIADHLRSIIFTISDGQRPSNNHAGYILRKILRRSIIYAFRFFNNKQPFLYKLVDIFIEEMNKFFPELKKKKEYIQSIVEEEEISFFKVINKGYDRIKHIISITKKQNQQIIDGNRIFQLYDTYGFPFELSKIIAKKNNLLIDKFVFNKKLLQQQQQSNTTTISIFKHEWIYNPKFIEKNNNKINFIGYDNLSCKIIIIKYRKIYQTLQNTFYYELVFSQTPFYPESGGQIGDIGYIKNNNEQIKIENTTKENLDIIHIVKQLPNNIYDPFVVVVDKIRRTKIEINHTSTHLLYFALKTILGKNIEQKGSYIGENYLRFDFSYHKKISLQQLNEIVNLVQEYIEKNFYLLEKRFSSYEEAKKFGYIGKFNTKYTNEIRIITFGDSSELCIGTHVKYTKDIKIFEIISESSIAYGIRRITAMTSNNAIQYLKKIHLQYQSLKELMNGIEPTVNTFRDLITKNKQLIKKINTINFHRMESLKKEFLIKAKVTSNMTYIFDIDCNNINHIDLQLLKKIGLSLRLQIHNLFMIVGFIKDNQPILFISISDLIIKKNNINAYNMMKHFSNYIIGKYWGKSFFSIAIGKKINGLTIIAKEINDYIKKQF